MDRLPTRSEAELNPIRITQTIEIKFAFPQFLFRSIDIVYNELKWKNERKKIN